MNTTLKQMRKQLNMTQAEVAKHFGVSRRSYQSYENDPEYSGSIKYSYFLRELENLYEDESKRILSVQEIQERSKNVFSKYEIEYCYLFGSYAKNQAREDSDVDLLLSTDITGLQFYGLVEELRETLRKKVDVVELGQVENNKELLNEILRDGIKIYGQ